MGYYIVGLLKAKGNIVEGYVLLDSANNDAISFVSKANLIANMSKNDKLIVNAKLTGNRICRLDYPLTNLSSVTVTNKKRRLDDKGVLAVYSIRHAASPSGIGFKCFRLRVDPTKSDIGIAARESLLNPGVKLINKIDGTIYASIDPNLNWKTGVISESPTIYSEDGVEKKIREQKQTELSNQDRANSSNENKLYSLLEEIRPNLETGDKHYTQEELIQALENKMLNPYVDVTYKEFRVYMLIKSWGYKIKYVSDKMIKIYDIDEKCKVLHLPENTNEVSLGYSDATVPVNRNFDFVYLNNDRVDFSGNVAALNKTNTGGNSGNPNSLTIGTLAFGGKKNSALKFSSEIVNNPGVYPIIIKKLILPDVVTELMGINISEIGEIDFKNISRLINCFNDTVFSAVPVLGNSVNKISYSFNRSNILDLDDLSNLTNIISIETSFCLAGNNIRNLAIDSPLLRTISMSFAQISSLASLDLSKCERLTSLFNSFSNCPIGTVLLPEISEEMAKSIDKVNLSITNSFGSVTCSKITMPRTLIELAYCFDKVDQDIEIEVFPYTVNYDPNSSNIVGISYLSGYKPNFKFTVHNFELPNSKFIVKKNNFSSTLKANTNRDVETKLLSTNVAEVVPNNSVFYPRAFAGCKMGLFDTSDFKHLQIIQSELFGSRKLRDTESERCYIDTLVIGSNIQRIDEYGFAGITGVRNIYLSPDIKAIDTKAFSSNYLSTVCNVYTTAKSPVCSILKNKKGFNLVLVDDFDKAVQSMKHSFTEKAEIPAKFSITLRNNPLYNRLLQQEYASNIRQAYNYLRQIESGVSEQVLNELPGLYTNKWANPDNRSKYTDSELFNIIIDSQLKATRGKKDSPQAIQIFNGLNNMLTEVLGEADSVLTKTESIQMLSWFCLANIGNSGLSSSAELEEYCSQIGGDFKNIINLVREKNKYSIDDADYELILERLSIARQQFISKYKKIPYSVDKMVDLIIKYTNGKYNWATCSKTVLKTGFRNDIKFLYCDNNKSAIFTLKIYYSLIDTDRLGEHASLDSFTALYIMYNGEIVWAKPLLMNEEYRKRFWINYNNINRYTNVCTFALKEGDLIVSDGKHRIGGIELDNYVIEPVLTKSIQVLSNGEINSTIYMPNYDDTKHVNKSDTMISRVQSLLFPIAGKSKTGKFYTQLVYDVFMQRFYEVELCKSSNSSSTSSSDLGKHEVISECTSMRIIKVWNINQIDEIPKDYFKVLQTSETNNFNEFSASSYCIRAYGKFKMACGADDIIKKCLSDASLYTRDNTQSQAILAIADKLYNSLDNAKPTIKMFNVLEKAGLFTTFKTKPTSFIQKRTYTRVGHRPVDTKLELKELKLRDGYCNGQESLMDTGFIKSASREVLIDKLKDSVIFSNYVYYHDEPGMCTDKIRSFYTSMQSLDSILKLLKIIGISRTEGLTGLGGLSNDTYKSVVSMKQIIPFYCPNCMKFKVGNYGSTVINIRENYDSEQYENFDEYRIGIGVDLGNAEIYSIAVHHNQVIVLFRHDDLKSAAMFQATTCADKKWAYMAHAIAYGLGVSIGKEFFALRDMIIKGYNSGIPFVTNSIKLFGITDEQLANSMERTFNARVLNLLTKQPRR